MLVFGLIEISKIDFELKLTYIYKYRCCGEFTLESLSNRGLIIPIVEGRYLQRVYRYILGTVRKIEFRYRQR